MSHLLDDDDDLGAPRDRELTLSTSAILGLFFGLVVLCGVVFAFGYSMGRHKTSPADTEAATGSASDSPSANFTAFKPAAGSPAGSSPTVVAAPTPASATTQAPVQPRTAPSAYQPTSVPPASTSTATSPTPVPIVRLAPPPATTAQEPAGPSSASGSPGFFMVQVAAVSHKEDADLLLSALRGRGYTVMARTYTADPLIHIQVGPFSTRKDAEVMRSKLLGDGYNAIVK